MVRSVLFGAAALALTVAAASAETWSCEYQILEGEKHFKQEWIVSGDCVPDFDCRMTAPGGKGYYLVAHNDARILIAFHKFWNEKGGGTSNYIIIEKDTGRYMALDDIVVTVLGPKYKDCSTPGIQFGHCTMTRP